MNHLIKLKGSESKNPKVFENFQQNHSKYLISKCLKNWKVCEKREFYGKIMKYLPFYLGILHGVREQQPPDSNEVFMARIDNSIRNLSKK